MSVKIDAVDTNISAKKTKKKHSAKYYAITFFAKIAATALIAWIVLTFISGVYVCHDNSSFPMIKDGDLCIIYRLSTLKQGDEVVYNKDGKNSFGRIIASEGDIVDIKDDYVSVNGYCVFEDAVYATNSDGAKISFPYTIPDNCVFVMNDFRNDISDSRTNGGIPLDEVKGKVVFIMRRRGI